MQGQEILGPSKRSLFIGSIILGFDALSGSAIGLFIVGLYGSGDPAHFSLEGEAARNRIMMILGILVLLYFVTCLVSPIFWRKGKPAWKYVVAGLGLLNLAGSGLVFLMFVGLSMVAEEWTVGPWYALCASLPMNLALLAVVGFTKLNPSKT